MPADGASRVASGASGEIRCTDDALLALVRELEAACRAHGLERALSLGGFPPSEDQPTASYALWAGEAGALALIASVNGGDANAVSVATTPSAVRWHAAHALVGPEPPEGEAREALVRLAEGPELREPPSGLVSQALLAVVEALDRSRTAIREQERASVEIRSRLEQVERNRAHAAIARALGHHFHNRLEVIQARADLAALLHDDELTRRCADEIAQACRSCCDTLIRLESYTSRRPINAGAHYPADEVVTQALARLAPLLESFRAANGPSLTIRRELACDTPLHVPREDLEAAIEALIVNAVEAMPEGGEVTVRTRREDGWAVLEVSDSGTGMEEDVAKRVFNPFYTTKGGGRTGLSLSQVHALVVEHGGSVELTTAPGAGSAFQVRLPGFLTDPATGAPSSRRAGQGAVLVIEDEDDVRTALVELLEHLGYRVVGAPSGHVAERLVAQGNIALVLTDLGVPDLTAFALARRLRSADYEAPIVLLTGWGHDLDPAAATEAGIDLVLTKPIAARTLAAALEDLGLEVSEGKTRRT